LLIDTSTLLRTIQVRHAQHEAATRALEILPGRGLVLHIVPQNLFEFWVVATRPVEQNGLSMSPDGAARELAMLKNMFDLLPDTPTVYPSWERLVSRYQVAGKPAHDGSAGRRDAGAWPHENSYVR
jgi:hypothetical protein